MDSSEESTSVQEKGEYAFGASRKSLPRVDKNDRLAAAAHTSIVCVAECVIVTSEMCGYENAPWIT